MDDQLTLFGALPPYEETKQIAELLRVRIPDDSKKAFRRVMLVLHQQVNHIEKAIEDN